MEVKRILWPTDFSENAAQALPYVTSLTEKYQRGAPTLRHRRASLSGALVWGIGSGSHRQDSEVGRENSEEAAG